MIVIGLLAAASLSGLAPGAVVPLPAGDHPKVTITDMKFDPPVVIEAGKARVNGLVLSNVEGLVWRGGTIVAPAGKMAEGPTSTALNGRGTHNVRFDGTVFTSAARGMVVSDSHDFEVVNSDFTDLRRDGINFVGGSGLLIENNRFREFTPIKQTGSKEDGTWKDGDHPDAIQLWTSKKTPYGRNYTIKGNTVEGDMQGINFFGPYGQGYTNVKINNNIVKILYPSGITFNHCTGCEATGNVISKFPGSKYNANLRIIASEGRFCDNKVVNVPRNVGNARC